MESVRFMNAQLARAVRPRSGRIVLYGAAFFFGLAIISGLFTIAEAVLSALQLPGLTTSILLVDPLILAGGFLVVGGLSSVLFGILQLQRKDQGETEAKIVAVEVEVEGQTADSPKDEGKQVREPIGLPR